jgi:hypothetical protein
VSLSEPASIVIGALITGILAIPVAYIANRKARPSRDTPDAVAWRKTAGQLLDIKDRTHAAETDRLERQHKAEVERLIQQYESEIQYLRAEMQHVRTQLNTALADLAAARAKGTV